MKLVSIFKITFYFILHLGYLYSFGQKQSNISLTSVLDQVDSLLDTNKPAAKQLLDSIADPVKSEGERGLSIYYHKLNGDYYLMSNKYAEAIDAYEPVLNFSTGDLGETNCIRLARATNDLGIAYMRAGKFTEAKRMHAISLELYDRYNHYQGGAFNYNNLALIYQELKLLDSALFFYEKSLEFATLAEDSAGIGYNSLNIAILLNDNKEPIESLRQFQNALKIFELVKNEHMINTTKRIMALHYIRINDFETGLEILRSLIPYYEQKNSPNGLGDTHQGIAHGLLGMDQLDSAKFHLDLSLKYLLPTNYSKAISKSYHLLGNYHEKLGDNNEAKKYYRQALEHNTNLKGQRMNSMTGIAQLYLKEKQYDQAIKWANNALEEVGHSASVNNLADSYDILYKAHKALGQTELSLSYLEQKIEQQEVLTSQEKSLEMARIEYKNELDRLEADREAEGRRRDLLHQQELEAEHWMAVIFIIVSILLAIIALLSWRSIRIKKAANQLLEEKNAKLKELRELEKSLSIETIASKERALAASAMATHEKNSLLETLETKIETLEQNNNELKPALKEMKKTISESYALDKSWNSFIHSFQNVHPEFFDKLKAQSPKLTMNDLKISAYLKVGMSNKEIANVTHLTHGSVKSKINRLKKKLGMAPEDNIRDYFMRYSSAVS
ncbi:MAG: tetratricopeptide repeat protein [Marinoscillum sp.]